MDNFSNILATAAIKDNGRELFRSGLDPFSKLGET